MPDRREYNKQYRRKNLERLRSYDRVRNKLPHRKIKDKAKHEELQKLWNNGINAKKTWKEAERLAFNILNLEGFVSIERTNFYFPFDYWAKKKDEKVAIEVTCTYKRQKQDILKRFLLFSRWKFFILFITPDLKKYILKNVPENRSTIRAIASKLDFDKLNEVIM